TQSMRRTVRETGRLPPRPMHPIRMSIQRRRRRPMPKVRKVPARMCVACKQMRPKRELIRVVRTPAGEIKVDVTGKLSGRGAYVCPTPQCAEAGVREGRLQHALLAPIPEDVGADLERAIETVRTAQSRSD